ncbi:MAG: hypothetical protein FGM32_07500 [Candidatus Kapabacteria bacterium]|nr:hypothetical protein [Candidatus Kapabacteria bacterium]
MKRFAFGSAFALAFLFSSALLVAQMPKIQYWRAYDRTGIGVFETPKTAGADFSGVALRIGGGFTQAYQMLSHENYVSSLATKTKADSANMLYTIGNGFNNASANLNVDAQLAKGVRMHLALYLSSRHHQETWVKGGYIQMDDLGFLGSSFLDDLMQNVTVRVGHMEVNFGDSHFRRSDGGQTMYNPFVENYLVDFFATEIGGDITYQSKGFLGVVGVTNGEIKGNIVPLPDSLGGATPAIYAKLGYDDKIGDDMRLRVTGSVYTQSQSPRNTLTWGDRTGSNYFMVMEKAMQGTTPSTTTSQAWSGRLNPNFANNLTVFEFNAFFQAGGLEFFGTYNMGTGSASPAEHVSTKGDRSMSQIAADVLYRFGGEKNFYVGARYNLANIEFGGADPNDASKYLMSSVDRIAIAAGWQILDNMLLKGEYVMQNFNDFAATDYRNGGKINGAILQAVVGF